MTFDADGASPNYWLRLIVRYFIASAALSYGIIKFVRAADALPDDQSTRHATG